MSTTSIKVKVQRSPQVKAKALVQFPSSVTGVGGISVVKENGNYTISSDAGVLGDVIGPGVGTSVAGEIAVFTDGNHIAGATPTEAGAQPVDATLTALAALDSSVGAVYQTGADTFVKKTLFGINVKDYGAIGDGATDNTTSIQTAIDALATAGGGILFVPPGTFKISSELLISSGVIKIEGSGRAASLIKTTSQTANVFHVTTPYVEIDSLAIAGPQSSIATVGCAIYADGGHGCKFTNLNITDVFDGVVLNNSTNCLVQFNKLVNIYDIGVQVTDGGGDYIVNNQLDILTYGPAFTMSSGFGAWAQSTGYAAGDVVSANDGWFVCSQSGTSASSGTGPAITIFGTEITDGTAKWYFNSGTGGAGVWLDSTANSDYVIANDISGPWAIGTFIRSSDGNSIVNNVYGQNLGNAVQLGMNTTNTLVDGNVIVGIYGTDACGVIDANGSASGSRVTNNYIQGVGSYGIIFQSSNFVATGNTLTNIGQITGRYGIEVVGNLNNFTIAENVIIPSVGMTGPIIINSGSSDYYNVVANSIYTGTISDLGTGTNKTIGPQQGVLINPSIIGGSGVGSSLSLKSTTGNGSSDYINFLVGNNGAKEALRILTNGQVSIGGVPPTNTNSLVTISNNTAALPDPGQATSLQIGAADGVTNQFQMYSFGSGSPVFQFFRAKGTNASKSAVTTGDTLGAFGFGGYQSSSAYAPNKARVLGFASEDWTAAAQGTYITFETTATGTTTRAEAMRVQPSGGLSVGTTGDPGFGGIALHPGSSVTPANNGDLVIQATSNTSLTFKYKGSDGTVRSVSLTLS